MKIDHLKWADRYLGGGLCLLLGALAPLMRPFRRSPRAAVHHILVMKFFGIGSIVFLTPLFRALRATYPSAHLTFVTFEANRRLAHLFAVADEVVTLRVSGIRVFLADAARLVRLFLRRRFEMAIDVEFFSKFSAIMAYLSGAPIRVGYYAPGLCRGRLLTERVYYNHYRHITDVFLALAGAVGADVNDAVPSRLTVPTDSTHRSLCGPNRSYVVINVNASALCLERRWPAASFVALTEALLAPYPHTDFVFIGDASERDYVAAIVARIASPRVVDLSGRTTFDELLGVLAGAVAVVTNDSGPLHLACALGTPVVALFGPETPLLYGPKSLSAITIYKGIYCSPCLNVYNSKTAPCGGDNQCMKRITIEEVLSAVNRILAREAVLP